jgi:hypothetical protein
MALDLDHCDMSSIESGRQTVGKLKLIRQLSGYAESGCYGECAGESTNTNNSWKCSLLFVDERVDRYLLRLDCCLDHLPGRTGARLNIYFQRRLVYLICNLGYTIYLVSGSKWKTRRPIYYKD